MKNTEILYTCNVTLSPKDLEEQAEKIPEVLEYIYNVLYDLHIRAVFFIDTVFLLKLKDSNPNLYLKIHFVLKRIATIHYTELYINSEWLNDKELHELDKEALIDIFAQAKHLIQNLFKNNQKEKILAVRVRDGKIQPFQHLQEVYQMFGIKVDASILPRIKFSNYYDFSSIRMGETVRFSHDPNKSDRFGKYLGISRAIFTANFGLRASIYNNINKVFNKAPKLASSLILKQAHKPSLVKLPVPNSKNLRLLSPDVVPLPSFQKIMDRQRSTIKHLCVLESNLSHISPFTKHNLEFINKPSNGFSYCSLDEVITKYSTTYNKQFK